MLARGDPRRGSALPVAMVFAVLLASLSFFLLGPIRAGREIELREGQQVSDHYLMRGGLEAALHQLRLAPGEPVALELTAGTGHLSVQATPVEEPSGVWLVQITVMPGGARRGPEFVRYAAVRLGTPHPGGLAPVQACAWGRTPQVVNGLGN